MKICMQEIFPPNKKFKNFPHFIFILLLLINQYDFALIKELTIRFDDASKYTDDIPKKNDYPAIENLDDYVFPLTLSNCLITVENSSEVNHLNFSLSPVILIGITRIAILSKLSKRALLVFGPEAFYRRNLTSISSFFGSQFKFECPQSRYLDTYRLYVDYEICSRINFTKFWSMSKPWNCMAQITLYSKLQGNLRKDPVTHSSKFSFPNFPSPFLQIFVDQIHPVKKDISLLANSIRTQISQPCNKVVFIFLVEQGKSSPQLVCPKQKITAAKLIRICPETSLSTRYLKPIYSIKISELHLLKKLVDLTLPSLRSNLVWSFGDTASKDTVVGYMEWSLKYCADDPYQKSKFKSEVGQIGFGYSLAWLSALGNNYTIISDTTLPCTKGISLKWGEMETSPISDVSVKFTPYLTTRVIFPYFPREVLTGLRFVSCGRKRLSSIAFHELIYVFDHVVWTMILVSSATLAIFIKVMAPNRTLLEVWLPTLKLLVEQGDNLVDVERFRLVFCFFAISGVVLSNAYKNTNVYNMVTPRRPIPYEYAKELVRDNFSILTRFDSLEGTASLAPRSSELWELNITAASHDVVEGVDNFIVGLSEVASTMKMFLRALSPPDIYHSLEDARLRQSVAGSIMNSTGVLTNSRLGSMVKAHLTDFSLLETWKYQLVEDRDYLLREYTVKIRDLENHTLYERLRDCKQVALILPEYLCQVYARRVKVGSRRTDVFVGKEVYTEVEWMFSMKGIWPRQILTRIKVLYESGHWLKWVRLFKKGDAFMEEGGGAVTAARMDGNIIVIFVVWISGQLIAICCHFLEIIISFSNLPFR